jgi:hypothetical protein
LLPEPVEFISQTFPWLKMIRSDAATQSGPRTINCTKVQAVRHSAGSRAVHHERPANRNGFPTFTAGPALLATPIFVFGTLAATVRAPK